MASNPSLRFRWDPRGEPLTLGGMLVATLRSRWGDAGRERRWGDVGNYSLGLDHVQWFYDHGMNRWVLASLPNIAFSDDVARRCMDDLRAELARVNAEHRLTAAGQSQPDEALVAYFGEKGASWRIPGHPLVIIASNLVAINLGPFPEPV